MDKKEYDRLYYLKNKKKRNKQNNKNWKEKYSKDEAITKKRIEYTSWLYHNDPEYREKALIRAKDRKGIIRGECVICKKSKADCIHHISYKPSVFIEVCFRCHGRVHTRIKGGD